MRGALEQGMAGHLPPMLLCKFDPDWYDIGIFITKIIAKNEATISSNLINPTQSKLPTAGVKMCTSISVALGQFHEYCPISYVLFHEKLIF